MKKKKHAASPEDRQMTLFTAVSRCLESLDATAEEVATTTLLLAATTANIIGMSKWSFTMAARKTYDAQRKMVLANAPGPEGEGA